MNRRGRHMSPVVWGAVLAASLCGALLSELLCFFLNERMAFCSRNLRGCRAADLANGLEIAAVSALFALTRFEGGRLERRFCTALLVLNGFEMLLVALWLPITALNYAVVVAIYHASAAAFLIWVCWFAARAAVWWAIPVASLILVSTSADWIGWVYGPRLGVSAWGERSTVLLLDLAAYAIVALGVRSASRQAAAPAHERAG